MKYKIVTLCLLLLCSFVAFTQNFSNKGTDFWITYPAHIDGLNSVMGIYITSDVNASGTVLVNGQSIPFSVVANTVTEKFLGSTAAADASNSYVYLSQSDVIKTGAAIHVVSDNPVVVYAHIIHSARSGATLVLPTAVWGREYIVPSYKSAGTAAGQGYGTITVVAADSNTTIQITPVIASSNGARVAGTAYPITLVSPGDVYQVQFKQDGDISGTIVQSVSNGTGCKKIAVFSSTTWSAFGCNTATSGDNLFQQLFPTGAWGKSFLTAPAKTRNSDIIRVFVSDSSAVVTKTENGSTTTLAPLINNSFYEYTTGNPTFIQSDKTASVVQYFTTMLCQNGSIIGDPEMIVINPIEQTINNITVFSAHKNWINNKFSGQSNITNCYLNIIIKTNAQSSFKINNAPPNGSFIPIQGTLYSYLQEDVTNISLTNPVQNLKADSNFIAIAYGFGNVESYGYNAGTNVIDLTQGIIIQNAYATTISQATCTGMPVSFAVKLSYQPTSINWDFGNNTTITPNAIVSFNNPNPDSSFLDANSGKTIYVYKLPGSYNFSATGNYPVKVTANNPTSDGCSGIQVITYTVQVYSPPVTNFGFLTSGCATDSVHFTDMTIPVTGTITKWIWDFNDLTIDSVQNPAKKYGLGGNYNVHLRTVNDIGCFADTTKTVALSALPDIKFGVKDTTCVDGVVTFNDSSAIAAGMGTINTWIWSYGDGSAKDTVNTNASRMHVFNQLGKDTVYLNLMTNTGCSEVMAKYIDIHPHPVPGFILPEVCLTDAAAQFADTSTIADGSQAQFVYAWNFNAGSPTVSPGPIPPTSTSKNPSIKYNLAANYAVSLQLTSKDGCAAFLQKPFTVNGSNPKANFTILQTTALCSNDSVRINDISKVDFGSITTVEIYWDAGLTQKEVDSFPTSGTGAGKTYSHLYPNTQQTAILKHYIRLVAYSGILCVDSKLDSVTIHQSPLVQFTTLPGICKDTIPLQITQAVDTRGVPGSFLYTGTGVNALGLYTPQLVSPGTYPIKYLSISAAGCRDSATQPITVWPSPVAKWGITIPDCERNTITFTDSSVANFSSIANWYWNFGDGITLLKNTAVPFAKTYASANAYTASLRVMTDSGCRSAYNIQTIKVNYVPVVNFVLPLAICLPDGKGKFVDASTIGDNSQLNFSYLWNFGDVNDPSASTLQNPTHQFTALGPYTVTLKVTSKDGCIDSLSQSLAQVYPQPKADFSLLPAAVCVNDGIAFTDQSNGITSSAIRWIWDLAEGYTASTQNASRLFKDSGTFSISLSIYNGQGCVSDTAIKEVTIYPYPKLTLGPGRVVLQGGVISIIPQYVYGTNLQYLWTPSTYLNSDTTARPQASPPEDIMYKLTLTGIGNCTVYDSVTITVLKTPMIPNAFSPNGDGINDSWSIRYLNSYPGCSVDVYNRYGQVVFHSIGYNTDWDGKYKGVPIPVGTYYYIINPKNGRQIMSGSVTIIR